MTRCDPLSPFSPLKVAVIGSGVSGNAAAFALQFRPGPTEVVLYEKEPRIGGHCATVDIEHKGRKIPVDTGFIVYNEHNYPELTQLFSWLQIETKPSQMSFSVSEEKTGFEWCGSDFLADPIKAANALFARRRHLASPRFIGMLFEIARFQKQAIADLRAGAIGNETLGAYLIQRNYSPRLRDDYLVPMGAAIWSSSPSAVLEFPALTFLNFFDNHCLLQANRPKWRTVAGGSRAYVEKMTRPFKDSVRQGCKVVKVERSREAARVTDAQGHTEAFDHVIIAAHAPQALGMLSDASDSEREILGAFRTSANEVYLHNDPDFMPRRKAAWAAWNFQKCDDAPRELPSVTYWMNALQGIDPSCPLFVTLNPRRRPARPLAQFIYDHPQFDTAALDAQKRLSSIQGVNLVSFCGAWTGYGFHEDGFVSGLAAAEALGGASPWHASSPVGVAAE